MPNQFIVSCMHQACESVHAAAVPEPFRHAQHNLPLQHALHILRHVRPRPGNSSTPLLISSIVHDCCYTALAQSL